MSGAPIRPILPRLYLLMIDGQEGRAQTKNKTLITQYMVVCKQQKDKMWDRNR
jgi:hypothetical protein